MRGALGRLLGLVQKERREMLREPSNVLIGIVLPVLLLIIFGFGLSLDVKSVRLAVVAPQSNARTADVAAAFASSGYFSVVTCPSEALAADLLAHRRIDAAVVLPQHPDSRTLQGTLRVQLVLNATDANMVRAYQNAIETVLRGVPVLSPACEVKTVRPLEIRPRLWFNDANESSWFLIPGVIVIIMSLIGCMLTAMQVAKEYEHGTMESLFATPVSPTEILCAKMVNNFILGLFGLAIALVFARVVFHVPMQGSLGWILVGSSVFLLSQMGFGLVISSATKSQFVSAQIATLLSFLPVFFLSGFIYEIPNMPTWMQLVTYLLPARYFVEFLLTAFLTGDVAAVYCRDLLPLLGFVVVFFLIARRLNPKEISS